MICDFSRLELLLICIDQEPAPNYQAYKRKIFQRKSGFNNCMKTFLAAVDAEELFAFPFIISLCLHKNQKWEEELDSHGHGKQRFAFMLFYFRTIG